MTALAVIVAGPDPARGLTALNLAAAAAALGRPVAMLFDAPGVVLLSEPQLTEALATARELGVEVTACTTGVSATATPLPDGIEPGGMLSFLQAAGSAQLVVI